MKHYATPIYAQYGHSVKAFFPLPSAVLQETQLPLPDGRVVQYARLHYFSHEATAALSAVVASAEAEGRVAGYVIDLRNDPGGVFEEAVAIASLFQVCVHLLGGAEQQCSH